MEILMEGKKMAMLIKNQAEYESALAEIEKLMETNPLPSSENAERLELLTLLVESYESNVFEKARIDPIDAIMFRMEQQKLSPRDLVPYIGSRSKVSEVLSRKRPLTLSMMQALHKNLGIPAKILLQGNDMVDSRMEGFDWSYFPVKEM